MNYKYLSTIHAGDFKHVYKTRKLSRIFRNGSRNIKCLVNWDNIFFVISFHDTRLGWNNRHRTNGAAVFNWGSYWYFYGLKAPLI